MPEVMRQPRAVVVTRPQPQAQVFANKLHALGMQAEVFPLLAIQGLEDESQIQAHAQRLHDYALVAFVSPNAIHAFFKHIAAWPSHLPIAILGEGSRQALAQHGVHAQNCDIFSPDQAERSDSESLLSVLQELALHGKQVLIVRGTTGREFLGDALRSLGVEVTQLAAYRRFAPELDAGKRVRLQHLLNGGYVWVLTSSEALRNLVASVTELRQTDELRKMYALNLFVPHPRIAESARNLGFNVITLTASGDEALLVALQSCL